MIKVACTALAISFGIASLGVVLSEEPTRVAGKNPEAVAGGDAAIPRSSLEDARRQAELLHTAIHSTLQAVHHQYYRPDESLPIPAAVLKDVFAELEKEQHVKLRWLTVEGQAMNSNHKPQDPFEIEAVKALKSGKRVFEQAEHGVYRRAGTITLSNQCLKCHVPDRKSTENRTAGLTIAIQIDK